MVLMSPTLGLSVLAFAPRLINVRHPSVKPIVPTPTSTFLQSLPSPLRSPPLVVVSFQSKVDMTE